MGILADVMEMKRQKNAEAQADINAIPLGIKAFTDARTAAQTGLLQQLTYNLALDKFNLDKQKQPYEIGKLEAETGKAKAESGALSQFMGGGQVGNVNATEATIGGVKFENEEALQRKSNREVDLAKRKEEVQSSDKARVQMEGMKTIESDLDSALESYRAIPEKFRGPVEGRTKGVVAKFFQESPELNTYEDTRGLILANISREFGGEKGVLTDRDVQRIQSAFPDKIDTDEVADSKITFIKQFLQRKIDAKANIAEGSTSQPKNKVQSLPKGVSEADISHTMKLHKLTREEVLKRLR